jgi:hypothetical protein
VKRYFDFAIPPEAIDEVLNGARELECVPAIIETAELDQVRDDCEIPLPGTPWGMNLSVRLPSRAAGLFSLVDQVAIGEILASYGLPPQDFAKGRKRLQELEGRSVIAHVGMLKQYDGEFKGMEFFSLYGISPLE